MPGKKRKASAQAVDSQATRRQQPRRAPKRVVTYEESEVDEPKSDGEFNEDLEESEATEERKPDDEDDSDASDEALKKDGWTKGKGGRWEKVISIPGEKDPGEILYEDGRIHPNTMEFLKDLKKNNRRDWLKLHDAPYRQAEKDFQTFVGDLSLKVSEKDPTIPELPVKSIIYRIYRDLRFTPDPTPYKPYFSVSWSRGGRKSSAYAHYYLQVQPNGGSFFGGGYYSSDAETLACLREDIDQQSHQFKSILMSDKLRKAFFPSSGKDEKKIIAAFCAMNAENSLKTKPKGYPADHKDIALLKLRNFIIHKSLSDAEIASENGINIVADLVEAIEPFITYMNNVVMPDRG